MARDRVEYEIVGKDTSGSKTFRAVGDAADKAADQVDDLGKASDKASDQVKGLGDSTTKAGDDADDAAPKWRGLAAEIEAAKGRMADLAAEIDKTGNLDLTKDIRRQEAELRKLSKAKGLLPDLDDEADRKGGQAGGKFATRMGEVITQKLARLGEPIGSALSASFSTLPPQAQAAVGASVAGMAAVAAPLAGAAIAGAIVGAAGGGGVVGGLALAAKDARVKSAASSVGDTLGDMLSESASAFVPVAVDQLGEVRSELLSWQPEIKGIFDAAAEYVDPLVEGALGFGRALLPGIREAVEAAGPFFSMLADELPELGQDVGELFATAAEYADEGAAAVGTLLDTVGLVVDATRYQVSALAEVYSWYLKIEEVTGGREQIQRFGKLKDESDNAASGLRGVADAAEESAREVESLNQAIQRLANENISAAESGARMEEAIDRAAEAAKRNNDGINDNTEAGRKNLLLLTSLATATQQHAADVLAQTGSQEAANAAMVRGRDAFIKAATGMGVAKAEAERLAAQMFAIPEVVHTKVVAEIKDASGKLTGFEKRVRALDGTVITIRTRFIETGSKQGEHIPGAGTQLKYATGGRVIGPGSDTSDSVPIRASRDEYVIRAPAARAIGYDVLDALNRADREPVALSPGRPAGVAPTSGAGRDDDRLATAVRRALSGLTLVLDDRSGRTATLIARGG